MRDRTILRIALLVLLAVFVLASPALAQKTLNQSKAMNGNVTPGDAPGFPVTLSKAGAYKLIGNLTVPNKDTTAIEITADNVTLDLNGFGIFGPGGQGTGVGISAFQSNITVTNGSVRSMGSAGIFLGGNSHRVEKVYAMLNGGVGIFVDDGSTVTGCTVNLNVTGISARNGGSVSGNTVRGNTFYGLDFVVGPVGYANNVLSANNGGDANLQVAGGTNLGHNLCGVAICP